MLRVNVATRPFYNERGVHLILALTALALLGVTALNVWSLVNLSAREGELTARTSQQESRARELRGQAAKLRASVRQDELEAVLVAAREANGLIDQRTFSWTELFNHLETTLPDDVMLTAVRPSVEKGEVSVALVVVGRQVEGIDNFMERLEKTGAFHEVLSRDERARDDGNFEATLIGRYDAGRAAPPAVPVSNRAAPRGGVQ